MQVRDSKGKGKADQSEFTGTSSREALLAEEIPTLSTLLDSAWALYIQDKHSFEGGIAWRFIQYAFNIDTHLTEEEQQKQAALWMADKEKYTAFYPEYIPGKSPRHLNRTPEKIEDHLWRRKAIKKQELLVVNETEKGLDVVRQIKRYNAKQRAAYRVMMRDGYFEQEGKRFDTSKMMSHGKEGYAAFTLNLYGELSVFPHHFMLDGIAHSTLNSGDDLVGAGEVMIVDGVLMAINTYSGHYTPTLYHVFRTLTYFESQGIDVSGTKIYLEENPAQFNLDLLTGGTSITVKLPDRGASPGVIRYIAERQDSWKETNTINLMNLIRSALTQEVLKLESLLTGYKASQGTTFFKLKDNVLSKEGLTHQRVALVDKFEKEKLSVIKNKITHATRLIELDEARLQLKRVTKKMKRKNNKLSRSAGKEANTGRLASQTKHYLSEFDSVIQSTKKVF